MRTSDEAGIPAMTAPAMRSARDLRASTKNTATPTSTRAEITIAGVAFATMMPGRVPMAKKFA